MRAALSRPAAGAGARVGADLRLALRRLRRAPGLSLVLVGLLGGGIGLGASVLSMARQGAAHPAPLRSPIGLPVPVPELPLRSATAPRVPVQAPSPLLGAAPGRDDGEMPRSIARVQRDNLATMLGTLGGVAGLAVALVCGSVALLLLSRAAARRGEVAMRAVLGATPARVAQQLALEGAVLAAAGLTLGASLGLAAGAWLRASWPHGLTPWLRGLGDGGALALGAGLPLACALLFSVAPALSALGRDLHSRIAGGARATAGPREGRVRGLLTTLMVASSFALLTAAMMLLRGFDAPAAGGTGLDPRDTLTLQIALPEADPARRAVQLEALLGRVAALPGVEAESLSSAGAWVGLGTTDLVHALTGNPSRPGILRPARYHAVSPGHFRALDIPVVQGREFTARDRAGAEAVAVVNETFAFRLLPRVDPLGKRLQLGRVRLGGTFYTVVGVVREPRPSGVGAMAEPVPALYLPMLQVPPSRVGLAVRTRGEPEGTLPALRRAVRQALPSARVLAVGTLAAEWERFRAPVRWFGGLLGALAALITLLAGVGLAGVIAYNVRRRTREIGVRMALGAAPRAVVRMVVAQGLRFTARGLLLGGAGALCLGRLLQFHFHGVRLTDPVPPALAAALVVAVTLLASYLPARRAASVEPTAALRAS